MRQRQAGRRPDRDILIRDRRYRYINIRGLTVEGLRVAIARLERAAAAIGRVTAPGREPMVRADLVAVLGEYAEILPAEVVDLWLYRAYLRGYAARRRR